MRIISRLSLEEEERMTRIFLFLIVDKNSSSSFLSREVGRGSLLLSDAVAKDLPRDLFFYPYRYKKLISCLPSLSFVSLKLKELRLL